MRKSKDTKPGFTLTEVVVSVFIITVLVGMSGAMIRLVGRANTESINTSAATTVAQSKIEEMRNIPYANISSHTFTSDLPDSLPHPRSAQVTVTQIRTGVKRVAVAITYDGVTQSYVTYVSENGISG